MNREETTKLIREYIKNENLVGHCLDVAAVVEAFAQQKGLSDEEVETWWTAGALHDLDWEMFPDEHPNRAITEILPKLGYPDEILAAIAAHAPGRTGKSADTDLEKALFSSDEISGFVRAVGKVRPNGILDLESKSVVKRLKDKSFAAGVSRADINTAVELMNLDISVFIDFVIKALRERDRMALQK